MKSALPILLAAITVTSGLIQGIQAAPANGSFESAVLDGWRLEISRGSSSSNQRNRAAGSAAVASTWEPDSSPSPLRSAIAGNKFAILNTLANGNFMGNRTYNISLSQTLVLAPGETVTGWSSFFNGDFEAQDSAWVKILDANGNLVATPWLENSGCAPEIHHNETPFQNATPWTQWSWQSPANGSYTLSLGMTTHGDNNYASYGFFDDILVVPTTLPVPEPSSLSLVAIGVTVLAIRRRMVRN